jgi:hypothetical protein
MAVQHEFVKPSNDKGGLMQPVLLDAAGRSEAVGSEPLPATDRARASAMGDGQGTWRVW